MHERGASVGIPQGPLPCRQTNMEIPDGDQVNNEFAKSFSSTSVDNDSRRSEAGRGSVTDEYPQPYPHAVHTSWAVPHGFAGVIPNGLWIRGFRICGPHRTFTRGAGFYGDACTTRSGGVGAVS